jgi:uncharacterized protein with von Willebrand factor type A (vWA) domain
MNLQFSHERLLGFMNHLRQQGYVIGSSETTDAFRIMNQGLIHDETLTRNAIRSLTCRDPDEWKRFDRLFDQFWYPDRNPPETDDDKHVWFISRKQHKKTQTGLSGTTEHTNRFTEELSDVTGSGAGKQKSISKADFRFLNDRNAARKIERLAEQLALMLRKKMKRRALTATRGNRIDIRKTLRGNMTYGGLPLKPLFTRKLREEPHLIILHDVSHSMAWNNPLLFRFARGLVRAFKTSDAFVFHTRLFCVTSLFREQSIATMKARLEDRNHLWMGGTCIAESIDYFIHHYHDTIRPESMVLIISDGFDTNETPYLSSVITELRDRCRQVLWLNPMAGREGFQLQQDFEQQIVPKLDLLAPAHSLDALKQTIRHIARARH